MAKGSSGGKRGGSAGGGSAGGGGDNETPLKMTSQDLQDYKSLDRLSDTSSFIKSEEKQALERIFDNKDKWDKFVNQDLNLKSGFENRVLRGVQAEVRTKLAGDSSIIKSNDGFTVSLGKGTFEIKDKLKDIGYKFGKNPLNPAGVSWKKEYKNLSEARKELKGINLI
jgi:hypothetical protein